MDKFLFTDGTDGVREAGSEQALEKWIQASSRPGQIKIWVFNNHEWISLSDYRNQAVQGNTIKNAQSLPEAPTAAAGKARTTNWIMRFFYFLLAVAGVFLVFNFTKIKWERAEPVSYAAARPENVPLMDIDSLINVIEFSRGQQLDRSTRTNLRLRNTWPEKVLLEVKTDREKRGDNNRFFNVDIILDNATGFTIDKAVVKLAIWKQGKQQMTDTIVFQAIRYEEPARRMLDFRYRGDSISVSFESIRAKAFNFCYSAAIKNNSGNYNDRWFCRD